MSSYVWGGRVKVTVRCVAWFCWCAYMLCLVGSSFRIGSECKIDRKNVKSQFSETFTLNID